MDLPDPWERAEMMGAPSKEELDRQAALDTQHEEDQFLGCPKCGELMERVSSGYDIEAELETGEPVLKDLYVCSFCGYEETHLNGQPVGGSQ